MGSLEMKIKSVNSDEVKKEKKGRVKKGFCLFPCMSLNDGETTVERTQNDGSLEVEAAENDDHRPTHLVVLVHGIIGSVKDWKFPAKKFVEAFPRDVIVHCSDSNSAKTLDGVDVMGKRLAEEVLSAKQRYPNLQKISFIGHSLGGLISRYAIAKLYRQQDREEKPSKENGDCQPNGTNDDSISKDLVRGKIAGMQPMNFITLASPHLGVRGHRQVPIFSGVRCLERFASCSSWAFKRTGKHLFLTDGKNGKQPLLLQMASDTKDLPFISALESFKRRVVYANVRFDKIVGWSTSTIRPRYELPKPKRKVLKSDENYPHVVNIEPEEITSSNGKGSVRTTKKASKTTSLEEAMIRGLTRLSWERVDVSFYTSSCIPRLCAHNTIQVQMYCIHSDGADVIEHIIDNFVL